MMSRRRVSLIKGLYIASLLLSATTLLAEETNKQESALVPLPQVAPAPANNPTTKAKVTLGRQLFFDPRLSGDNATSCASCHAPEKGWGDGVALGKGFGGKTLGRNSQSCLNVGFYKSFFWDGRANSLEEQSLGPITSPVEMNQSLEGLEKKLATIPGYVRQFKEVFGTTPNRMGIAQALAAFQRTLITGPSPFDRHLAGDKNALSDDAKRGLELFRGDAGCIECHNGPLLSDGKFYRLGVSFQDEGRAEITGDKSDRFRFRTPSLRNIAETGPYMHDGSLATLDEVVTFYYRGIPRSGPDGLSLDTEALSGQSFSEIPLLVAFLKSLTGKAPEFTAPLLPGLVPGEPDSSISPAVTDKHGFQIHKIESPYQSGQTTIRVLLPEEMKTGRTYPVVYVLPVEAKDQTRYGDGLIEIQKHDLHNRHQAIFVAPTFSALPWYADHPEQSTIRQETYFMRVVVPFVEQTYSRESKPSRRFLLGFSKSGWGAWSLLLRHPDIFGRAAAWDAPMMMQKYGKYGNTAIFQTQDNFERYRISDLLKTAKLGEEKRLILSGYGGFRQHHQQLHDLMTDRKIPHLYRDGPQRKHDWHSGWVREAVQLLLAQEGP